MELRQHVPDPPTGVARLRWWGPGLLWAMSAVGSGSVLFTPRVGSEYGYELLWLLWGVAVLMWVMIREAGRFAVATGRTLLDGFSTLPGPRNWALWVVLLPQLVAAVAGVGGLSALVGSAFASVLPGGLILWSLLLLLITTTVVVSGGYPAVSRVALVLALVLVAITVVAAAWVFQADGDPLAGVVPGVPSDLSVPFILPWVGTILAGSMGIVWFSYWTARRGYGGGMTSTEGQADTGSPESAEGRTARLRSWFGTLSNTAAVGVLTGTVIITAFLVLGAELLAPAGIVPSGIDVADDLMLLLSEVWGTVGHWLMFTAIVVALGGSVLANQDGWSRAFADITMLLSGRAGRNAAAGGGEKADISWTERVTRWRPESMGTARALKILFAVTFTSLIPALVIVVVQDPVVVMSASGIVASVHTPFIVLTTLAVNRRIPDALRPSRFSIGLLGFAGLFYAAFAVLYFLNMLGLIGG
ncbi:Nramp family divalent metal transporter [Mycolicibacterium vanbaalenii]|uniref:Nramp family divalent metal transporter n=1 Tax=Mycolicibacterium vanbaalenii TaxID=110539 RepID=UPI0013301BB7|nr:Nramp family divalent metal transporter [Mycolicibacterium vanbaalenii]